MFTAFSLWKKTFGNALGQTKTAVSIVQYQIRVKLLNLNLNSWVVEPNFEKSFSAAIFEQIFSQTWTLRIWMKLV